MSLTNWLVVVLADGRFYPRAVNLVVNSNELPVSCHGSLIHSIGGSRVYICSGGEPARNAEKTVWTRAARQRAFGAQMGGLCTGALALAKAGVLSHLEITPHWEKMDGPRETFSMPNPSEKAYVVDGRASASAGGTTSAELFLTRLQSDFGPNFATIAREMMKIADARSPDARQTNSRAAILYGRNKRLINIIRFIDAYLEAVLGLDYLARRFSISQRQMERLFMKYLRKTHRQYISNTRIGKTRQLLVESNLSVMEVAVVSRFNSSANISKLFRTKFGVSPGRLRTGR